MKRKVVKLGPASYVVSLPSKWTKKLSLKAGDELEVTEQDHALIISTEKEFNFDKETVDFRSINHLFRRIISAKYIKGASEIEIHLDSPKKSRIVQKRVDELIGMEIIEQNKERLLIRTVGSGAEENFDQILNRVFYLIHAVSQGTTEALKNKETDLEHLEDTEKTINRFTDYCLRLLNKESSIDHKKRCALYCMVTFLEELADSYKDIVQYISAHNLTLKPQTIKMVEEIHTYYQNLQRLFQKFSYQRAVDIAKERDKLMQKTEKYLQSIKNPKEVILLTKLQRTINLIIEVACQLLSTH